MKLLVILICTIGICTADLSSQSSLEGPCIPGSTKGDLKAVQFLLSYTGAWNVVMAHKLFIRKYFEFLQGNSAQSCEELGQMNLTAHFTPLLSLTLSGLNREILHLCTPTKLDLVIPIQLTCKATTGSLGTNITHYGSEDISILWTDYEKTLVFGKCLNGDRLFSVWSKPSSLDQPTFSTVRKKLIQAGYDPAYFEFLTAPCKPCKLNSL